LTYEFCAAHGVSHRRTGKLVVASSPADSRTLEALLENGHTNGLEGLKIVDRTRIRQREPHVEGFQAIEVPSTGILSSEELFKAYARIATNQGAHIVTHARVERLEPQADTIRVISAAGEIHTKCLVNSAGLFSDEVAAMLGSSMAKHHIYPVRGEYCELVRAKQDWIRELVYPLPHSDGLSLGVHFTKTLWGGVLVGPTARYVDDKNNYERGREPVEEFVRHAKVLLPDVEPSDLVLAHTGIRAKLTPPLGASVTQAGTGGMGDFIIQRDPEFPRVVQLIGIDSPGLTSAPSIAEQVSDLVAEILA
jgi:glycerol-3-phosphate dehydrogenase